MWVLFSLWVLSTWCCSSSFFAPTEQEKRMTLAQRWCHHHLLRNKEKKNKKRRGDVNLPSSSHFSSSCFYAPIATTLKLLTMSNTHEAPISSCFHTPAATTLKLLTSSTFEALVMEVSTKGGGWGGGQQDEGGRWVGRKKGVGGLGIRV